MSTMNVNDIEEGLRRLLAVKSGDAEPTRLEKVQLRDPSEWDDDDWEFANQRGLVPPDQQTEYQRRVIERRHQSELAALGGTDLPANFTGNVSTTGVATVSPVAPGLVVDGNERLRQIELEEERLRQEKESLAAQTSDDDEPEDRFNKLTVPKLQEEISRRNQGRSDEDTIEPDSQRKPDLVAALVEDDELQAGRNEPE